MNSQMILTCCTRFILVTSALCVLIGCAVHYYDTATGTEHIWGVGHLKMKATKPNENLQAVVYGTDTIGVSIGKAANQNYVTIGWQNLEYIDILKESTSIRLEWPNSDFFNVRIGSEFPKEKKPSISEGKKENHSPSTLNREVAP